MGFHCVWNSQWEGLGATRMGTQSISSRRKRYLSQASLGYTVTTAVFTSHTWSDSCYRNTLRGKAGTSHSSYASLLLSHGITLKFPSYACHSFLYTFIPGCFVFFFHYIFWLPITIFLYKKAPHITKFSYLHQHNQVALQGHHHVTNMVWIVVACSWLQHFSYKLLLC